MSIIKRIAAGMGALVFGQVITIGIQLASLPLFLHYWPISKYGLWLVISAIPSYFSMADVGMVTAAGNKMTMALGRGDGAEANRIFQSAMVFTLITCGTLAFGIIPAVLMLPLSDLHDMDQRIALCALIIGVLFSLFGGLSGAIFRATNRFGLGTTLANLTRLAEWGGSIVGLILFGSLAAVALGGLGARLICLMAMIALSADGKFGIKWHYECAQWREIRAMTKPALSFMLFPLSNALSFQGMTLLAGYELGPIMVVTFNTYRTIARVAVQAISVFSFSLEPVFSLQFGKAGASGIAQLYRRAASIGLILALCLGVFLYFIGPTLLRVWTHARIAFDAPLMLLMLVYAAVAAAWHVPRILLTSTNEHSQLALWSTGVAAISLILAIPLCRAWNLVGLAAAMLLSELTLAAICARLAKNFVFASKVRMTPEAA
jgi:O-antigen/teichoic acid export membrane protein